MKNSYSTKLIYLSVICFLLIATAYNTTSVQDFSSSPVVSAENAIKLMEVEDGFKVELVASEPLLNTPTTMVFDEKGRIWVAEMPNFMLDTIGTGEELPTGKIVILEDKNEDGIFENRQVFLDSLILPRAISLFSDGALIAEPPYLWFVPIENDKAGKKVLVDDKYAVGGNVEHQPNGLLRGLDNWIYNAKSDKRYRRDGDKWIIEKTHFRGQWGIAQDNYGRLYYNHNSTNVIGDYFSPGFGTDNKNQRNVAGFNATIVGDTRVYPSRPTLGVNRGYMEGILDNKKRLANFTAASALTIYRGDLFGKDYEFNAFVPEPAANLIKRNILKENGSKVEGKQAYEGKEFLRSTDERFRPVYLSNAPDGALYIVDMYRGIIQHKTYLTGYLKQEIKSRDLEQPNAVGRIYRVVPEKGGQKAVTFPKSAKGIVELLGNENGWVRDKAQQILIDRKSVEIVPKLESLLKNTSNPLATIHALWTLEGLKSLKMQHALTLLDQSDSHIKIQALIAAASIVNQDNYSELLLKIENLIDQKDEAVAPTIAYVIDKIESFNKPESERLLVKLVSLYPVNVYVADAVINGLQNQEADFLKLLKKGGVNPNATIYTRLGNILKAVAKAKHDINTKAATKNYPKGAAIFSSTCATCHGKDGYGIESLAPQLNGSDWVLGDKNKVISTVLFGLTGPIVINNETTDFSVDMPGIGQNPEFTDADIAQLISFIRNAWSNNAAEVKESDIKTIRNQFKGRTKAFTQKEADEIWKKK